MRKLHPRRFVRNPNQYDLFAWAEQARRLPDRESQAVREMRRRGYRTSTARLLAELAGYPTEVN